MKFVLPACLFAVWGGGLLGQAAPATPQAATKAAPDVVAGIPVNYDEAKVGTYTLADPLKFADGKPVRPGLQPLLQGLYLEGLKPLPPTEGQ